MKRRLILSAALLAPLAAHCADTTTNCPDRKHAIPVNVFDRKGRMVMGLPASVFHITYAGKQVHVLGASTDETPRRAVLMLDASGSMTSATQTWATARFVAIHAMRESPRNLSWALMVFKARVIEVIPFGHAREEIVSAIVDLEHPETTSPNIFAQTALIDSLAEAFKLFGHPQLGDAIFSVTDGGNNIQRTSPLEVENELIVKGVRVFAYFVEPPGRYFHVHEEEVGRDDVIDLIKKSGGSINRVQYTIQTDKAEFEKALKETYSAIADFYPLEVQLPEGVLPDKNIRVNILNSLGKESKEYRIAFPVKLGNCQQVSR